MIHRVTVGIYKFMHGSCFKKKAGLGPACLINSGKRSDFFHQGFNIVNPGGYVLFEILDFLGDELVHFIG